MAFQLFFCGAAFGPPASGPALFRPWGGIYWGTELVPAFHYYARDLSFPVTIVLKTIRTDFRKAGWEHVHQKTKYKFSEC